MSLILAVVDRGVALVKRREDVNRASYNDLVAPLMAAFEAVHQDYLAGLRRYISMVAGSGDALNENHPVMNALRQDALFSDSLRWKLRIVPASAAVDKLVPLLHALENYLKTAIAAECQISYPAPEDERFVRMAARGISNEMRWYCVNHLYQIALGARDENEKRRDAIELLETLTVRLQTNYRDVLLADATLKTALLEPM